MAMTLIMSNFIFFKKLGKRDNARFVLCSAATILDNIRYARPDATDEEWHTVAKAACFRVYNAIP